jgi:hypothetical protein
LGLLGVHLHVLLTSQSTKPRLGVVSSLKTSRIDMCSPTTRRLPSLQITRVSRRPGEVPCKGPPVAHKTNSVGIKHTYIFEHFGIAKLQTKIASTTNDENTKPLFLRNSYLRAIVWEGNGVRDGIRHACTSRPVFTLAGEGTYGLRIYGLTYTWDKDNAHFLSFYTWRSGIRSR